jgi:hypothetical protein
MAHAKDGAEGIGTETEVRNFPQVIEAWFVF